MKPLAIVLATIGALLGASVWAGVSYITGYQIGWMAIAVGALVGGGALIGGGEGKPMAIVCAGLALIAMFAGNVLTVQIEIYSVINEIADEQLRQEDYTEQLRVADEFSLLTSEESYPEFIFENTGISEAASAEEVTEEDIEYFESVVIPDLRRLSEERPPYETWREEQMTYVTEFVMDGLNTLDFVLANLGFMDLLFAFLGLSAAMRMVSGTDEVHEAIEEGEE